MKKSKPQLFTRRALVLELVNVNPSLIIFLGTIFAYVVAILYESSFLRAFGIAPDVIEISPVVLFYSLLSVIFLYLVLELFFQFTHYLVGMRNYYKHNKKIIWRWVFDSLNTVSLIFFLGILIAIYSGVIADREFYEKQLPAVLLAGLVLCIVLTLFPLLFYPRSSINAKTITAGLDRYYQKQDKKRLTQDNDIRPFDRIFFYIYLLSILLLTPAQVANYTAHSKNEYYVWSTSGSVKTLVIKHYGRSILLKDYDVKKSKFLDGFTLANTDVIRSYKERFMVNKWVSDKQQSSMFPRLF